MTDRPSAEGARTALLIVHLQPDIIRPEGAFGVVFASEVERRGIVERVNQAIHAVREAGGVVVTLRIAFRPDYSDASSPIPLLQAARQSGSLRDGTETVRTDPAVRVGPGDVDLVHTRPGPFTGSGLEELLRERGLTRVVVCGVATNASVEAAVRQAADLDFKTIVLADACSAADMAAHNASLASMGAFGLVQDCDEFREALRG